MRRRSARIAMKGVRRRKFVRDDEGLNGGERRTLARCVRLRKATKKKGEGFAAVR